MRRWLCVTIVAILAAILAAEGALGRPGRKPGAGGSPRRDAPGGIHGDAPRPGADRPDGRFEGRPGRDTARDPRELLHRDRDRVRTHEASQARSQELCQSLSGRADNLFTPAWYAQHPNAWKFKHPHADAWTVATFGTAAAWVGLTAQPVATYETSTSESTEDEAQADAQDAARQATELATSTTATDDASEWLPLGVFALSPAGQTDANAALQLAVGKQGALRGSYYDMLSDSSKPIQGGVAKKSQRVSWFIGENKNVVFQTNVDNLTQEEGTATLYTGNGRTQKWTLIRLQPVASASEAGRATE